MNIKLFKCYAKITKNDCGNAGPPYTSPVITKCFSSYKHTTSQSCARKIQKCTLPTHYLVHFPSDVINEQFERDIETEHFIHLMSVESHVTDRKIQEI